MSGRLLVTPAIAATLACVFGGGAKADVLADLADQCMAAIAADDRAGFDLAAEAIKKRQDTYNSDARRVAEDCLSKGYGEPWEYDYPSKSWLSSAFVEVRLKAAEDAKFEEQRAAAQAEVDAAKAEAARAENAERVAALVYVSCLTLFTRDQVAAMTSPVCVESFLQTGLPASPAP